MDPRPLHLSHEGPEGSAGQALAWVRRRLRWSREARTTAFWGIQRRLRAAHHPSGPLAALARTARICARWVRHGDEANR